VIVIVSVLSIFFIYGYENMDEQERYTYSPDDPPSSLKIELDMNNASVEIKFTNDLSEPVVEIEYHKNWRGIITRQPSFETSSSKVTFTGSQVFGEADSELTVILRSDVEYDIVGTISSGSIALNADYQGVTLGTVNLKSTSGSLSISGSNLIITEKIKFNSVDGSASVNLKDSTIGDIDGTFKSGSTSIKLENCFMEDIHVIGESGSAAINSKELIIDSHSSWTFDVDSGSVALTIDQSSSLGADVTVDAAVTGKKDIKVNFNGNATFIRAEFSGNKMVEVMANTGFNILDSKTLQSSNFGTETLDKFEIKMTADKGDLEVETLNL
jgi:hypothetical protein